MGIGTGRIWEKKGVLPCTRRFQLSVEDAMFLIEINKVCFDLF